MFKDVVASRCHLDCVNMIVLKRWLPTQIQAPFWTALPQLQLLQCFSYTMRFPALFQHKIVVGISRKDTDDITLLALYIGEVLDIMCIFLYIFSYVSKLHRHSVFVHTMSFVDSLLPELTSRLHLIYFPSFFLIYQQKHH